MSTHVLLRSGPIQVLPGHPDVRVWRVCSNSHRARQEYHELAGAVAALRAKNKAKVPPLDHPILPAKSALVWIRLWQ